jgi:hypothetical protein
MPLGLFAAPIGPISSPETAGKLLRCRTVARIGAKSVRTEDQCLRRCGECFQILSIARTPPWPSRANLAVRTRHNGHDLNGNRGSADPEPVVDGPRTY